MTSWQGYCPLHEFERTECTTACNPLKDELWRINMAYGALWYARRRGARPETHAYRVARGRLWKALQDLNRIRVA